MQDNPLSWRPKQEGEGVLDMFEPVLPWHMGIPESTFLVKKEVARSATIALTYGYSREHTTPSPWYSFSSFKINGWSLWGNWCAWLSTSKKPGWKAHLKSTTSSERKNSRRTSNSIMLGACVFFLFRLHLYLVIYVAIVRAVLNLNMQGKWEIPLKG